MAVIRVGVAASARAVRAGLRALLEGEGSDGLSASDPGVQVVYDAASLESIDSNTPDLDVLVATADAVSPQGLRQASEQEGRVALLLLTEDPQAASGLLNWPWRAWGLISLNASPEELLAAVRALHEGLLVGAPELMAPLFGMGLSAAVSEASDPAELLTERELQVLQILARGLANKQIAVELHISEHTVKFHVSSIYAKLGVASRTEAVRVGVQRGLVVL